MDIKRKLHVSSAVCDLSEVKKETLDSYESVKIQAALILVTAQVKQLLSKYNITMNAANIIEIPDGTEVCVQNGTSELKAGQRPGKPVFLVINGSVDIEKGTDLSSYAGILINGSVTCPKSMAGELSGVNINGSSEFYPDEAVRLEPTFTVDRFFVLRAKPVSYYAKNNVILSDLSLDVDLLAGKGVKFVTKTAYIAQSLAEKSIVLFDDQTKIIALPDGCAFISGDATLDDHLVRQYGSKLHISGSLKVDQFSGEALSGLDYLHVDGSVVLPLSMVEAFHAVNAEYDRLEAIRGLLIEDKVDLRIDKQLLENHKDGLTVKDVVNLTLGEDISPELIEQALVIYDCVNIKCTQKQRGAVEAISHDTVMIDDSDSDTEESGGEQSGTDIQHIKAAQCKL